MVGRVGVAGLAACTFPPTEDVVDSGAGEDGVAATAWGAIKTGVADAAAAAAAGVCSEVEVVAVEELLAAGAGDP